MPDDKPDWSPEGLTTTNVLHDQRISNALSNSEDAFTLSKHAITYNEAFTEFECVICGKELSMPDVFVDSSPSNKIAYQLYMIGTFMKDACGAGESPDFADPITDRITKPDNGSIPTDPNNCRIHWSSPNTHFQGVQVIKSDSAEYAPGDKIDEEFMQEVQSGDTFVNEMK